MGCIACTYTGEICGALATIIAPSEVAWYAGETPAHPTLSTTSGTSGTWRKPRSNRKRESLMKKPNKPKLQPGPPLMCYRSPSGIHYLPKVQKNKDGKWEISSPYLRELLAKKNTDDSGKT
jgi:hypothetical protein